jgi:hypothetical protein
MANPYLTVARTYIQQPFCSLQRSLIISGVIIFFVFLFFNSDSAVTRDLPGVFLLPFIALFAYWAVHVKEQFADARTSLTPGFRKIHGIVATIVAIIFVIFLPGVVASLTGWQSYGFVSISIFLFGIILWYILRPGTIFFLSILFGFILIFQNPGFNVTERIFSGKEPILAFIFICTGVFLSIAGIIRLFLLNEEIPEYHLNFKKTRDGQAELSGLQWQRLEKANFWGWWRSLVRGLVDRMIYHARRSSVSYWSKIHRWDYSGSTVWSALILATIINLFFKVIEFFDNTNFTSAIIMYVATFIPILMVNKQLKAKQGFFSRELMLPVRRDAYLKQVGMLCAYRLFIFWGVMIIVSTVFLFIKTEKPDHEFIIYSISCSLMMQIWFFGLAVWLSSFRSSIISSLIVFIALIFSFISIHALEGKIMISWQQFVMPMGCFLEAIGLLLAWWGYRRWLASDFD